MSIRMIEHLGLDDLNSIAGRAVTVFLLATTTEVS
jgi:hypothetical protein